MASPLPSIAPAAFHIPVRNHNGTLAYMLRHVGDDAWEADHRASASKGAVVYFIGGDAGAIKIGLTTDLPARLKVLQNSSPIALRVLARRAGNLTLERDYHLLFAASRLHGEWFERTPELLAEIERLNRQ